MFDKSNRECLHHGPLGADYRRPAPEPRLSNKDSGNPPIVTIFGAGVAGLSAAHELVDRGFLVQVVESERDVYARGRPKVGGMAATQYARVRANIEVLHAELLDEPKLRRDAVVQWLLRLFAFNRDFWLQTERPEEIHSCLFEAPGTAAKPPRLGSGGEKVEPGTIGKRIVDALTNARDRYREQWIWDLVTRSVLTHKITTTGDDVRLRALANKVRTSITAIAKKGSAYEVADTILKYERAVADGISSAKHLPSLPPKGALESKRTLVEGALQREFLCFRLRAFVCDHNTKTATQARNLLRTWEAFLKKAGFKHNLVPSEANGDVAIVAPPTEVPPSERKRFWLELEIVEQRLPGEHGFRFFPSCYRHLDETMKRTPLFDGDRNTARTTLDNLTPTTRQGLGMSAEEIESLGLPAPARPANGDGRGGRVVEALRDRPTSIEALRDRTDRFLRAIGCTSKDGTLFAARMLRFMTSGTTRRRKDYQNMSWAQFVGTKATSADDARLSHTWSARDALPYSYAMTSQIEAAAQCVLALSSAEADARTFGNAVVQMLMDTMSDGSRTDRTLNGPTSDVWLEPWREHLEREGVRFFLGSVDKLTVRRDGPLVPEVTLKRSISQDGHAYLRHTDEEPLEPGRQPDFYVLALSMTATHELLAPVARAFADGRAPDFVRFKSFHDAVVAKKAYRNMTGVQFFFDSRTSIGRGHTYFPYSPWGLSSISQSEFWSDRRGFAQGYFGVLTVDVSTVDLSKARAGLGKALRTGALENEEAMDDRYGRWLIAREVWKQLESRIGVDEGLSWPRVFHVDQNLSLGPDNLVENRTPYLGAPPGTWHLRPGRVLKTEAGVERETVEYALNCDRWVMCGTFMATHTRMTSMESANESARHAVKCILATLRKQKAPAARGLMIEGVDVKVHTTASELYNGAASHRRYDDPYLWDPEEHEIQDLALLRRVDEELATAGLPHWMDICDFDRRLSLMLDIIALHEEDVKRMVNLGPASAEKAIDDGLKGVESALRTVLGDGHTLGPSVAKVMKSVRDYLLPTQPNQAPKQA